MTVAWDFGDGATAQVARAEPVRHTYREPGDFNVSATLGRTVTDTTVEARRRSAYRNLLVSDAAASFEEDDLSAWSPNNASIERSEDEAAPHGAFGLSVRNGSGAVGQGSVDAHVDGVAAIDGQWLTAMAAIRPVVSAALWLQLTFFGATGINVGFREAFRAAAPAVGEWTRAIGVVNAPPDARSFRLRVGHSGNDRSWQLDRVGVFEGDVAWEDWALPSWYPGARER